MVTPHVEVRFPLPDRTVVKYEEYRYWKDPETGDAFVSYEIRHLAMPVPEGIDIGPIDNARSFYQLLPLLDDATEGVPLTIPYVTRRAYTKEPFEGKLRAAVEAGTIPVSREGERGFYIE